MDYTPYPDSNTERTGQRYVSRISQWLRAGRYTPDWVPGRDMDHDLNHYCEWCSRVLIMFEVKRRGARSMEWGKTRHWAYGIGAVSYLVVEDENSREVELTFSERMSKTETVNQREFNNRIRSLTLTHYRVCPKYRGNELAPEELSTEKLIEPTPWASAFGSHYRLVKY